MFRFLSVILFLIIIFAKLISHASDKSATSILLFGDSIIAGYGLDDKNSVGNKLQNILNNKDANLKIISSGVSGDTTAAGLARLEWVLEQQKPDILFLALGGNDILRAVQPEFTKSNLENMIKIAKDKNIKIILQEVNAPLNYGIKYANDFNKIYKDLAKKYDTQTYPFLLKNIYGNINYMQPDGIHPNERGALKIAEELAEYIIENL